MAILRIKFTSFSVGGLEPTPHGLQVGNRSTLRHSSSADVTVKPQGFMKQVYILSKASRREHLVCYGSQIWTHLEMVLF